MNKPTVPNVDLVQASQRMCAALFEICELTLGRPTLIPTNPFPKNTKLGGRPKGSTKRRRAEGADMDRLHAIFGAVRTLDPRKPGHWTTDGSPSITPIQKFTGIPDIARWEIEHVCPGYNIKEAVILWMDMNDLYFKNGQWIFSKESKDGPIRRKLRTADAHAARNMRDHFLETGNWNMNGVGISTKHNPAGTRPSYSQINHQSPNWTYSDSHPAWRTQ